MKKKLLLLSALICTLALALAGCGGGEDATAASMRLRKAEGEVQVSDDKDKSLEVRENLALYSGYGVGTKAESYGWIDLDSMKLVKLDESSEIGIEKDGGNLKIQLEKGTLFFHITEPLGDDESMEIRTSTLALGIRGTSGWIYMEDETHLYVYILEGTVQCGITDPESGETAEGEVSGGGYALLSLNPEAEEGSRCEIKKETFSVYSIPLFVMRELLEDENLRGKIADATGMEVPSDSTPEGYTEIGEGYIGNGNYEDAVEILDMALEGDSTLAKAYALRGNAYILISETQENLETAQADYDTALGLDEGTPGAYLGIADIHIRRGEYDEALEVLKEGLGKSGNDQAIADKIAEFDSGTIMDSQKKPRRFSGFDAGGKLLWYHEYAYDERGRKTGVASYDASGARTSAMDILYDEQGRCIQNYNIAAWDSGAVTRCTLEYDTLGRTVRLEDYNLDGTLRIYSTYEYEGEREIMRNYEADGTPSAIDITTKDSNGRRIKRETLDPDGTSLGYYIPEYDDRGNMIKYSSYSPDGRLLWYYIYEYNDSGERVSEQRFEAEQ